MKVETRDTERRRTKQKLQHRKLKQWRKNPETQKTLDTRHRTKKNKTEVIKQKAKTMKVYVFPYVITFVSHLWTTSVVYVFPFKTLHPCLFITSRRITYRKDILIEQFLKELLSFFNLYFIKIVCSCNSSFI